LFDLQTLKADEQAIRHFRQLINLPIEHTQRREIMFWMADSYKALEQFQKAALLYLQSAMYTGPESMDPWAQTARFNAAESLQKAGLVDDARRIYQSLLEITREPSRRSRLRHNIQQLWLTQSTN
jgi:tetratricopeptide (TPR) repeat protein